MGKAIPIAFGDYSFGSKKSAREEAQRRINKYEAGDTLQPDDEKFFASLFTLHSQYDDKIHDGIDHIEVERDLGNRCLFIHRVGGSKIDCSWTECIAPATLKTIGSAAFRRAVKDFIVAYKISQLEEVDTCPILGTDLNFNNSHVSYASPSFQNLLKTFLQEYDLDVESVELTNPDPEDGDQRGKVTDQDLVERWRDYHQQNAQLQLLSEEANLQRLKP